MVMTGRGGERGETVMFCYLYNSLVSSLHYLCLVPKKRNWFFTCLYLAYQIRFNFPQISVARWNLHLLLLSLANGS